MRTVSEEVWQNLLCPQHVPQVHLPFLLCPQHVSQVHLPSLPLSVLPSPPSSPQSISMVRWVPIARRMADTLRYLEGIADPVPRNTTNGSAALDALLSQIAPKEILCGRQLRRRQRLLYNSGGESVLFKKA